MGVGAAIVGGTIGLGSNLYNMKASQQQQIDALRMQQQAAILDYKATVDAANMMMAANSAAAGAAIGSAISMYNTGQVTSSMSAQSAAKDAKRVTAAKERDIKLKGKVEGGKIGAASEGITAGLSKARQQIVSQIYVNKAVSDEHQKGVSQISEIAGKHTKFTNDSYLATKDKITNIAAQAAKANAALEAQKIMAYSKMEGMLAYKVPELTDMQIGLNLLSGLFSGARSGSSLYQSWSSL
jgi:hypothetical protein